MFNVEKRTYRLEGITPILGSAPASPEIRTQYLISRAPKHKQEMEMGLGAKDYDDDDDDCDDAALSVFLRDTNRKDRLILLDYVIRGFFKAALTAGRKDLGIANERTKVDRFLFIEPRIIPIMKNGEEVFEEDGVHERPIRCATMLGERTALRASEQIEDPWTIEFTAALFDNSGSAKSNPVTWEAVENALDYGQYSGLGQWRSGGFGRFTWERVG